MPSLYNLTGDWIDLAARLDAAESDEEYAAIWQAMDGLEVDIKDKAEAYARLMRNKEAEAAMYKAEKMRLAKKQKQAEDLAERLKESIRSAMIQLNTTDIPTGIGKWRLQKNPLSCDVLDAKLVPEKYRVPIETPYTIDTAKAKADFKATGEIIPGLNIESKLGVRFK